MLNKQLIEKYRKPYKFSNSWQVDDFEQFLKLMEELLIIHEIEFRYQKRNCKRSGAAVLQVNRQTGQQKYKLLIDPDCKSHAQMNIFTHELMHILLDHLIRKQQNKYYLPQKAREFVVDFLAESMVYTISGLQIHEYQHEYLQYQNAINYRENWIKNARLSEKICKLIDFQISYGIDLLSEYLKERTNGSINKQ